MMGRARSILSVGILGWPLLLASATAGEQPRSGERFLRFRAGDEVNLTKAGMRENTEASISTRLQAIETA